MFKNLAIGTPKIIDDILNNKDNYVVLQNVIPNEQKLFEQFSDLNKNMIEKSTVVSMKINENN